ncbi:MAG: pentapeptide repeat-containing protein [Parvularculaceae bacterium]
MSTIPLENCNHSIKAEDADLSNSVFSQTLLVESDFSEVSFANAQFVQSDFSKAKIMFSRFAGVQLKNCDYDGMTIEDVPVVELLRVYRESRAAASES